MLYNKSLLLKRLTEYPNELLTERELLQLATPTVNNLHEVIELVQYAIEKGYRGSYSVQSLSKITSISRQTFYRWEEQGIITRKDDKLNIIELLKALKLIESR